MRQAIEIKKIISSTHYVKDQWPEYVKYSYKSTKSQRKVTDN